MTRLEEVIKSAERKIAAEMRDTGTVVGYDFGEEVTSGKTTIAEMIGTPDGAAEFLEKITFDLAAGQETVPLVYQAIYTTRTDENFPETMTEKTIGNVQTVFLQKLEGGEIKFGSISGGEEVTVRLRTYATGIEYDEDIAVYNQTWRVASIGESFGASYNKLKNHLHLDAIVSATYSGSLAAATATSAQIRTAIKNQRGYLDTDGSKVAGVAQKIVGDLADPKTWRAVAQVLPRGSVILHNSFDELAIRQALDADVTVVGNTNKAGLAQRKFANATFVAYDGEIFNVGEDVYEYEGVQPGECYVIVPKTNFVEYEKHGLRVDSGDGDLSRLVLAQVVGRTRRGLLAAVGGENGAVKVAAS